MNEKFDRMWIESRVEAMADGTLSPDDETRMLEAMRQDEELCRAVERARLLRRRLRSMPRRRPPRGLLRRLLSVPSARRSPWIVLPEAAGTFAVAAIAALVLFVPRPAPVDEREAAIRDFVVAMSYLRRSAELTHYEVSSQVGAGFADALAVSRASLARTAEPMD